MIAREDARELARQTLTTKEFQAWDLINTHGMTQWQASYHIGISRSSVRSRLQQANMKLTARLRAESPRAQQDEPITDHAAARIVIGLLIERDGPTCYLCSKTFPAEELIVEHIIPTSQGGTNEPANIALSCGPCNTRKGKRFVSLLAMSGRPVYHHV